MRVYLRSTALWPQKRWAIATTLYSEILSSPIPLAAYSAVLNTRWTDHELRMVVRSMRRAHRLAQINRPIKRAHIYRDWQNTLGAITKCVLSKEYMSAINGVDYIDLTAPQYTRLATAKLGQAESGAPFAAAARYIAAASDLALLFRLGFANEEAYRRTLAKPPVIRSQIRYGLHEVPKCELSDNAWHRLGTLVGLDVPDLRKTAFWGFY